MPIYTNPRERRSTLEEFASTRSQVFEAVAEDALVYSPLSSINRMVELSEAEKGKPTLGRVMPRVGGGVAAPREDPDSPMLDAETARAKVKEADVNIDVDKGGIRERALDIMIKRAQEDKLRRFTISQGPGGVSFGAQKIGVMLAASMLDPINVGSAFVPVVAPARYTSMLARAGGTLGRTGVRARVGAIEGVVGAAAVEPIVLAAARQEQADYDSTDSFLNIAFGTVFGGGLHVLGGGAMDAAAFHSKSVDIDAPQESVARTLIDISREENEALTRVAVGQLASGRQVNVEPVWRIAASRTETRIPAQPSVDDPLRLPRWLQDARRQIEELDLEGAPVAATPETPGVKARRVEETLETAKKLDERLAPDAELNRLRAEADEIDASLSDPKKTPKRRAAAAKRLGDRRARIGKRIDEQIEIRRLLDRVASSFDDAAGVDPATARAIDEIVQRVSARAVPEGLVPPAAPVRRAPSASELRSQAEATASPDGARLNDTDALRAADGQLEAAPKGDDEAAILAEEAVEDVRVLARQMDDAGGDTDLTGIVDRELSKADDLETTANEYDSAIRAMAECQVRRG